MSLPVRDIDQPALCKILTAAIITSASFWVTIVHASYSLQNANLATVDTSRWACKYCPDEVPTQGEIAIAIAYSDDEASSRFENSPAEGDGLQAQLDGTIRHQREGMVIRGDVHQLGLDNQDLTLEAVTDSDLRLALDYSETEVHGGHEGRTVFSNSGSSHLELPANWTQGVNTEGMNFDSSHFTEASQQRKNYNVRAEQAFAEGRFNAFADVRRVDRSGTDWTTGSILNNVVALPRPRDDSISEFRLGGSVPFELSNARGEVALELFESRYQNDHSSLAWDNPYQELVAGANSGKLADAPDNSFRQWQLTTNLHFANGQRLFAFYSMGKGEQDDRFVGYTENSLLATPALPATRYNGEVDTTNLRVGWDAALGKQWQLAAGYRFDERVNQSETHVYQGVNTDSVLKSEQVNALYSHKKSQLELRVDWRWRAASKFSTEYQYDQFERTKDSQGEASQHTLTFGWQEHWSRTLSTHLKLATAERDGKEEQDSLSLLDNPLYRDFTVADRQRDTASLTADWQSTERLNWRANIDYRQDDYDDTVIGVTQSQDAGYGIGVDWQLSNDLSTHLNWQYQRLNWELAGSSQQTIPTWSGEQDDHYRAIILGMNHQGLLDRKLRLGIDYIIARSESSSDVTGQNNTAQAEVKSQTVQLYMEYLWRPQWQFRVEALYENFMESDPQTVSQDTLSHVISNGINDEDYSEWLLGVRVKYLIP